MYCTNRSGVGQIIRFSTGFCKRTATLILSILTDKATLPARRLLHVIERCFVFLLCAVLFIALCMAPSKRITDNERYAKLYFTPNGEKNKEKFPCVAVISQKTGKVYSNLMAHIKVFHKNCEREAKDNQGTFRNIEISPAVMNIYGWIV